MTMTLQFNFPDHERTSQGTSFIQNPENQIRLNKNCLTLLRYWQGNNVWLNKYDCLTWLKVDCMAQRVANLINNGVPIVTKQFEGHRHIHYRIDCTCKIVGGQDVTENCWLHDENLKYEPLPTPHPGINK